MMRSLRPISLCATALAALLTMRPAAAGESQGPPRAPQASETPARAPRTVAQFRQVTAPPRIEKTVQRTTPPTAEDKGSLVTEGIAGADATRPEHEAAKLRAAREAVERAKAAGTRELRVPSRTTAEEPTEVIEARKQEAWRTRLAMPRVLDSNEAASPWLVKAPLQKSAPVTVTEAERAKAEAARTKAPAGPEAVAPAAPAKNSPARREGGR